MLEFSEPHSRLFCFRSWTSSYIFSSHSSIGSDSILKMLKFKLFMNVMIQLLLKLRSGMGIFLITTSILIFYSKFVWYKLMSYMFWVSVFLTFVYGNSCSGSSFVFCFLYLLKLLNRIFRICSDISFQFGNEECLNWNCLWCFSLLWRMAATRHSNLNRKKLSKLNIIDIW